MTALKDEISGRTEPLSAKPDTLRRRADGIPEGLVDEEFLARRGVRR